MTHGTASCYQNRGCKRPECRDAALRKFKQYSILRSVNGGDPLNVPAYRALRRLRALMRIGYSQRMIAEAAGISEGALARIANQRTVHRRTFKKIAAVYEWWHMIPGPSTIARGKATKKGWPPPLAWIDIDDPAEHPTGVRR